MRAGAVVDLVAALEADPRLRPVLELALEQEDLHQQAREHGAWLGWSWHDVRARTQTLAGLVVQGIVAVEYRSRSATNYRLVDPEGVREALRLAVPGGASRAEPEASGELPADLFGVVEELDDVKRRLRLALEAERPVHVLLLGPPASAKTVLLDEVARLPGGRYALGGTTTRAGLVGYLLAEPGCRFLVLDELDKMGGDDLSALLSVMETGRVTRLQHGRQESERRAVWVLAGANRAARFPRELVDRFLVVELEPYAPDQFRRVVAAVLTRREDCDAELAEEIAQRAARRTNSVRAAVRIARMARGNRRLALELIEELL